MEGGWNPSHLRQGAFAYSLHQSLPGLLYQQKLSGALGVGRCLDPTGEIVPEIEIGGFSQKLGKKNKTIGDVAGSRIKVSPKNWDSPCFVFPFPFFLNWGNWWSNHLFTGTLSDKSPPYLPDLPVDGSWMGAALRNFCTPKCGSESFIHGGTPRSSTFVGDFPL